MTGPTNAPDTPPRSTSSLRTRRQLLRDASLAALGVGLTGSLWGCGDDAASPATTTSPGDAALDDLAPHISGGVLRPGDAAYGPTSLPANGRFRAIRPVAIARCNDAADVAAAVRWSAEQGLAPTVRGGGHSYAGFSTSPALILDVSPMNSVSVDLNGGTITTGGSALNGDILDATVDGPGFLPGGTCLGVGVGGLTLGGGIGYNAHWAGLTSDLMVASTIVTADGEIRELGPDEHGDLYWACRGAPAATSVSIPRSRSRSPTCHATTSASTGSSGPAPTRPPVCSRCSTGCSPTHPPR
ncbi:MAG: FAD-binding protein [Ilumatobacteraceae bacterium]